MTLLPSAPAKSPVAALPGQIVVDWTGFKPFPSPFLGVSSFDASDSDKVRTYLDWSAFLRKWEIPVSFPSVLDDPEWGDAARTLWQDASALLNEWLAEGKLTADVVFGVWRASAEGDQVLIQPEDRPGVRITFPRLPLPGAETYCAANFIKPAAALKAGESDYIGGYAIRLSEAVLEPVRQWEAAPDDYRAFLATDLCTLYRQAVADYLHYRLRRFIWAYCDDDDLSNEEVLDGLHQGIRVDMGGPAFPNRAEQTKLLDLLGVDGGRSARSSDDTDGPPSVLCGFFFAHPRSRNFPLDPASGESTRPL